ncbi:MAG: D-alanine--D-alanine ligase family protein [Thermodesulfobacteriota bacterium]
MGKLRVALIAGGWSREREISLKSGKYVYDNLDKNKYEVKRYDPSDDLLKLMRESENFDLALLFLHGKKGEGGSIQGLLDLLHLPYVGSGVLASALAMNKAISKKLFRCHGLPVPKEMVFFKNQDIDPVRILSILGKPVVVKPVEEGSSIGLAICYGEDEIVEAINDTFAISSEVLLEEYIKGREVSCAVLGNRKPEALPVVEIIPQKKYQFFSYTAKYEPGASQEICPAKISSNVYRKIQEFAINAHCLLGCRSFSRSDMIVTPKKIYVLETNTIPGMTENSIFPLAVKTAGLSFSELLDRLIENAFED